MHPGPELAVGRAVETFLIDDPGFRSEIEKLDLKPDRREEQVMQQRRTLVEWAVDEGIVLSPPDDSIPEYVSRPQSAPLVVRMMSAIAFLALMVAGAGAAAFVFQERVVSIFAIW